MWKYSVQKNLGGFILGLLNRGWGQIRSIKAVPKLRTIGKEVTCHFWRDFLAYLQIAIIAS